MLQPAQFRERQPAVFRPPVVKHRALIPCLPADLRDRRAFRLLQRVRNRPLGNLLFLTVCLLVLMATSYWNFPLPSGTVIQDSSLNIEAEAVIPTPSRLPVQHDEVRYSRFLRAFTPGRNFDASRIDAQLRDGVLKLTVPRHEGAKPRRIRSFILRRESKSDRGSSRPQSIEELCRGRSRSHRFSDHDTSVRSLHGWAIHRHGGDRKFDRP